MRNKYLYAFLKDGCFRTASVLSVIGVVLCVILFRLNLSQGRELKDVHYKRAVIAQIPALRAKIAALQSVNGIVLNGIITDKAVPMAVINNVLVKVGEDVDGKKVIKITEHNVTVCDTKAIDKCMQLILEQ